jgi:N-methylhydantoinase A
VTGAPRLGVDTGGTFTDAVAPDGQGGFCVVKEPTTQRRPEQAVLRCARRLTAGGDAAELVHGTTHATNALLTGKVGRAVFVTSAGFADLLTIGRQERAELFALEPRAVRAPLPRRLVVEDSGDAGATVRAVLKRKPAAVAICLLHAHQAGPAQRREKILARALRRALGRGIPVFASHAVAPEAREVERGTTVWAHAALAPVVGPALRALAERLRDSHHAALRVMRSDGGTASGAAAAAEPAQLALSGPAAGLCAARALADARGDGAILTFDMGGTSTDVALLPPGETPLVPLTVGGLGLLVRGLPVHTVGTGGGSYAWRDAAGALEVGPESAGALPGPACYGRGGTRPTVSDAHLMCGRLHADFFLGGGFALHADRARDALRDLRAEPAQVLEIATAGMERALRRASLGEGWDPRSLTLYAFGGAGGLHACWLAARLGIPRVVVPPLPGAFCALGLLAAPPRRTLVRAVLAPVPKSAAERRALFAGLEEQARAELAAEGVPARAIRLRRILELRGAGQDAVFPLPDGPDPVGRFHSEHRRRFGYARLNQPVTLGAVRVQADGPSDNPFRAAARERAHRPAPMLHAPAILPESDRAAVGPLRTAWHRREELVPGARLAGRALIGEYSGTTVIPAGWIARVDGFGALVLTGNTRGGRTGFATRDRLESRR